MPSTKERKEQTSPPKRRTSSKKRSVSAQTRRQIYGVLWGAGGLFLMVSLLLSVTGRVGEWVRALCRGLLGGASFLLPVALILLSVQLLSKEDKWRLRVKSVTGAFILLILAALLHLFAGAPIEGRDLFSNWYTLGGSLKSGGVLGGALAAGLCFLVDYIGAYLILFVGLLICLMIETELTPYSIWRSFKHRSKREKAASAKASPKVAAPEPQAPTFEPVGQLFRADVGLGSLEPAPLKAEPVAEGDCPFEPDEKAPEKAPKAEPLPIFSKEAERALSGASAATKQQQKEAKEALTQVLEELNEEQSTKKPGPAYAAPPMSILQPGGQSEQGGAEDLRATAAKLVSTLKSFGVETTVINVSRGPTVTRYELQPSAGVKVSRITNLADDIALNLASAGVRIEAPIPGKAAVGIEIANAKPAAVALREVLETTLFQKEKSRVSCALGVDIAGEPVVMDLARMPHLLIAGATGSGKSVCINTIVTSLLYKATPKEVRLLMIDPKVVELGCYNGIPHLLIPVVTDAKKAAGALNWAVGEMLKRYKLFAKRGARDLAGYNAALASAPPPAEGEEAEEPLPQIVIIIDELADLMMAAAHEVEDAICRLAQMARAAGMYLVIATQRPSVDVITGVIKANIPSRISFAVSSQVDSRTILDMAGAEKLLGRGDLLYYPTGMAKPARVQGCYVSEGEVEALVDFIKKSQVAAYNEQILEHIEHNSPKAPGEGANDAEDELLDSAAEVVIEAGMASVSLLQRRLKLGYARAARIIDELEARGFVGPFEGSKPRQVLITRQQLLEMRQQRSD